MTGANICACLADDYPSGNSLVPPTVIGGIDGGHFPAEDGHNLTVPAPGADAIRATCMKHGQLWLAGDARPHTCTRMTADDQIVLLLWLSPAVKPPRDDVMDPPALLSTAPFPARRFDPRTPSAAEVLAIRDALAQQHGAPSVISQASRWKAIDAADGALTYYLLPGRKLPDTNGEETCANTAAAVLIKDAHGLSYRGELDGMPDRFVLRPGSSIPDAVVSYDCGKQMNLWQLVPKLRPVISYSNGYEYG